MITEPNRNAPQEPRVVILGTPGGAVVEVLQVPLQAGVGFQFCHRGGRWRITGFRKRSRVLFAEPVDGRCSSA